MKDFALLKLIFIKLNICIIGTSSPDNGQLWSRISVVSQIFIILKWLCKEKNTKSQNKSNNLTLNTLITLNNNAKYIIYLKNTRVNKNSRIRSNLHKDIEKSAE